MDVALEEQTMNSARLCLVTCVAVVCLHADEADSALPVPNLGVRQEQLQPVYSGLWTFVWVQVPEIPGCVLDLLCYEHSGMTYVSHRAVSRHEVELTHRSTEDPNVLLITKVTSEPGAAEIVARAQVDAQRAPDAKLPAKLPSPNLCFRVKRAEEAFSCYPDPFPEFISRCFIFTEKGRTFLHDTVRRRLPRAPEDDPRNNPPWVQMYTPVWLPVTPPSSGQTWYNTSTDRFTIPVIGVVSRDRKHLVALANGSSDEVAQAWQECLHNNPKWLPADAPPENRRWRVKLYVMPNDPDALLSRVTKDFPDAAKLQQQRVPETGAER
jgi:hypothetical protein